MNKSNLVITQDEFDRLLSWLDADRERAGEKFERIRMSLIKIFAWRGCAEAEELADETINRVAQRLSEFTNSYVGDPALYFYGIANRIMQEYYRRPSRHAELPSEYTEEPRLDTESDSVHDLQLECLRGCLQQLRDEDRELIVRYYEKDKQKKIGDRKRIASELQVPINALRVRVYRIRASLERCIQECMKNKQSTP